MTTLKTSLEEVDRMSAIKIASCTIFGITVVFFVARQVMKAMIFRRAALDDLFILLASTSGVALSVTTFSMTSKGLGLSGGVPGEQDYALMKGDYASDLLYISAICFSKLAILVFFHHIVAAKRLYRQFMTGVGAFILSWSVASLAAIAFRCDLPRPWDSTALLCFNTQLFWIVYCIIDVATEITIIMLSVALVLYLQLRISRKIAFVACFAPRVFVLSAAIVRLVGIYPVTPYGHHQSRLWLPAITAQIQVCLSTCTACIPYMVPFFKSLYGNLKTTRHTRSLNLDTDEESSRSSSFWFRKRQQAKSLGNCSGYKIKTVPYERVTQSSPYLPTPRPLSTLTPPRLHSPSGRQSSVRGLDIYIPCRDPQRRPSLELMRPLTASSCALSPTCASPQPLLARSYIPSRKAPNPPPKTYSPRLPTSSSSYSSPAPAPSYPQRYSLFPARQSPSRVARLKQAVTIPSSAPSTSLPMSQTSYSTMKPLEAVSPPVQAVYPMRTVSRAQPPKFSTTKYLQTPPLFTANTGSAARPESIQDLNSPMGAAINNYFSGADVPHSPATQPHSPTSATPTSHYGDPAHSPAESDFIQDELSMSRDSFMMTQVSRSHAMPAVRDVRNSPYVVVRSPI